MIKPDLREQLKKKILILDGAMGTMIQQQNLSAEDFGGEAYDGCNELLNVTRPDVIRMIHEAYLEAGADIIETNTFGATSIVLAEYEIADRARELNLAAARLAVEAANKYSTEEWPRYVAGAVGPTTKTLSVTGGVTFDQLVDSYYEQTLALIEGGVDLILLETSQDTLNVKAASIGVRQAFEESGKTLPIMISGTIEPMGTTLAGQNIESFYISLEHLEPISIGLNCATGPEFMRDHIRTLSSIAGTAISCYPNAGLPDENGHYHESPESLAAKMAGFAEQGWLNIAGGCCGTTPEHIAAMAQALQGRDLKSLAEQGVRASEPGASSAGGVSGADETKAETAVLDRPSRGRVTVGEEPKAAPASGAAAEAVSQPPREPSIVELVRQRHTMIVELDPPRDLAIDRFMRGAEALRDAGADMITLADNSLAVTRMNNMALGHLLHERVGIRPLVHIACRDRNLIGTQSHMMGLHALGIDHVLAVTGDPARIGDLPGSSSVYDLTSFEMIRMIKQLNEGIAFSGKPLKQRANFVVGAAFNPNVKHLDKAVKRLERKVEAGADFIMTQPVFDPALFQQIAEMTEHIPIPIFIGIMPLASGRNAEFLHNEVPGIKLSDDVRARMAGLEGEEGRKAGVAIAKELLDEAMRWFKGIYLMTPFLAYEMTVQLVEHVWETVPRYASN